MAPEFYGSSLICMVVSDERGTQVSFTLLIHYNLHSLYSFTFNNNNNKKKTSSFITMFSKDEYSWMNNGFLITSWKSFNLCTVRVPCKRAFLDSFKALCASRRWLHLGSFCRPYSSKGASSQYLVVVKEALVLPKFVPPWYYIIQARHARHKQILNYFLNYIRRRKV